MNSSVAVEIVEPRLFAGVVAEEIVASINEAVDENGSCSILLAGGQTPGAVYRRLALPPLVQQIPWDSVKLFWGDERWVPIEDNQSNAHMTHETLLQHVKMAEENIFPVNTALESPEVAAEAYEVTIREALGVAESGLPEFDIVLLGLGTDGHTASIFPGEEDVWGTGKIVVATKHPEGAPRISITPEVLTNAKKVFFLVKGEQKAEITYEALHPKKEAKEFPALLYQTVEEKVTWFLDSAAAQRVERE